MKHHRRGFLMRPYVINDQTIKLAAGTRQALKKLHASKDQEGLFDYLQSAPTAVVWNECLSLPSLGHWSAWVEKAAIQKRVKTTWEKHAKDEDLSGFGHWLDTHAPDLLKVEVWFVFNQSLNGGPSPSWLTPALSSKLLATLPVSERADLLDQPLLWGTGPEASKILRTIWDSLETADQRAALPLMIKKAAGGQRVEEVRFWEAMCEKEGVPVVDRDHAGIVRYAALLAPSEASREIIQSYPAGVLDLLRRWVTEEDDEAVDSFMMDHLTGETRIKIHEALINDNPGVSLARTNHLIMAQEREARSSRRTPTVERVRSRSRP
jgi:hypothetical protein